MNLVEFLQDLVIKGWKFWNEDNRLCYRAPNEESVPDVLDQLKQHKPSILQLLQNRPDIFNVYPLSYGQKALWFLWQLEPLSAAYNLVFSTRICDDVNVTNLCLAFEKLLERHPSLRSTFPKLGEEPIQQIHQEKKVDFQQVDASTWNETELYSSVYQESQRPFNLEQESVTRIRLFTRYQKEHILLLIIHHIATDGWSFDIILSELPKLYQAQQNGVSASLPTLEHSYSDYVRWQKKMLEGTEGEKLRSYWQNKLKGELPGLNLPTDRPRPPIQTNDGASHKFQLSSQLTRRLKQLASLSNATLYMILLAAFEVLLYRYTGQEDILVGSPIAGRLQSQFSGIVGYFVSPVVLRGDLSNNPSFEEFLSQIRQTVIEALTHQNYPFALLVEKLQPNRDLSRSPIFQASFVLQQLQKSQDILLLLESETEMNVDWGGLNIRPFNIPQEEGQFDLDLEMIEGSSSLFGTFKYNTDLFDGSTIERMATHFENLCSAIVENPLLSVGELPLLSETERHQLLVEWNETKVDYPRHKCIHQLFEEQVERTPEAVAVVFENQQLTYQELNTRANQLAYYLQSLGVESEVLVGICVERSLEVVVGLLGILKAGGAYVPLDPSYPQERLSYMLEDSGVEVLLTQEKSLSSLSSSSPNIQVVCLDRDWEVIKQYSQMNLDVGVDSDNLAYVIYTSGSTGKPKGVEIEHRNVINLARGLHQAIYAHHKEGQLRVSLNGPLAFDTSVKQIMQILYGHTLDIVPESLRFEGSALLSYLQCHQIDVFDCTPSHLELLISVGLFDSNIVPQCVLIGGEPINESTWQTLIASKNILFYNVYGPTECTVDATLCALGSSEVKPIIGRPIANTKIYILDSYLQPVPIGVPGELHIGGGGLARGYLNQPELTQEKFIVHPFQTGERLYKTGDLARYRPDGNIEFLSRIDNQVKIRGFRIELGEIETLLNSHPQIQQAVVIAREDIPSNKRLVAYLVASDESLTSHQLREFLKQKLPEYMVLSNFVLLENLPLTPNGKIDRKTLAATDVDGSQEGKLILPRDTIELRLAQIWSSLLNVNPIGVTNNFFELGGHSLLAIRMMFQIEQQFQRNLPLATLLKNPTIEQLANLLRSTTDSYPWSALVPIKSHGNKPPLFCIHPSGGNVLCYQDLAYYLSSEQPFYGLQSVGINPQKHYYTSIEQMATHYVQELQTVQPRGPYFLSGWSLGGLVAFEIAQQLSQQGEQIALLALIDTYPLSITFGKPEDNAALLVEFLQEDLDIDISLEELQQLEPEAQLIYVLEQAKQKNLFSEDFDLTQARHLERNYKLNMEAGKNYKPQYYSGSITLFKASQTSTNKESVWNELVKHIEVHIVHGNHYNMIKPPNVRTLAQQLQKSLDQAQLLDKKNRIRGSKNARNS